MRLNSILDHLSIAACLLLATLVMVKIIGMLVPISAPSPLVMVVVAVVAYLAFLIWSQINARQLGIAAGVADQRGDLHDELKSAYWFMRQDYHTGWTEAQVERAAQTARGLELKKLVPTVLPQRLWGALALGAILLVLSWVPPGEPLLSFAGAAVDPSSLTAEQEAAVRGDP